jgi:hypothetical protein
MTCLSNVFSVLDIKAIGHLEERIESMSILFLGRRNDSGDLAGTVSEIATVAAAQNGRFITAVRTAQGTLRLITWQVSTANQIARLADSADQAGAASNIDIARGTRVVTALRNGSGNLMLISWDVAANGALTRRGDTGNQAGTATNVKIVAVNNTLFVTACRTADGTLRLISWQLNANGSFTRLSDSGTAAGAIGEVSLIKLPLEGGSERVLTSVRAGDGKLKLIVWRVNTVGAFTRLGDSGSQAGEATLIRSIVAANGRVVTSVRASNGDLKLIVWGISANGATVQRLADSGSQAGTIGDNSLASLSDGVVSGVRTASGDLRLIAWSILANGTITRRSDSGDQAGTASLINLLPVSGVGAVTLLTAVRTADNSLRLISWGQTCVRLHVKIIQQPNISIDQMLSNMKLVYSSVGINLVLGSTENLNLPATFLDIDVGACTSGSTTAEQNQLFANRNNVGPTDVVAYFVRSTVPPFNGCASHPAGRPGAVVASIASQWTLAHEIGHVLGLNHVSDNNRLMTGGGTSNITNPPPDLVSSEASTMQSSSLTFAC